MIAVDNVKAAAAGEDAERLAKRREIKREIAERRVLYRKIKILEQQHTDLDRRASQAEEALQDVCRPIRARLKEIEAQQIVAEEEHQAPDAALATEQLELMQKIADQTDILNDAIARIDKLRVPLEKEIRDLRLQTQTEHLTNQLCQKKCARPDWFRSFEAAKNVLEHIGNLVRALEKAGHRWELAADEAAEKREFQYAATYRERIVRLREEASLLAPVMQTLQKRVDQLREQIIDE